MTDRLTIVRNSLQLCSSISKLLQRHPNTFPDDFAKHLTQHTDRLLDEFCVLLASNAEEPNNADHTNQ
jgi:hypothetical protein